MNITIVHYNGETEFLKHVKDFEFRTNHVTNWIRVKFEDGNEEMIHNIATIKATKKRFFMDYDVREKLLKESIWLECCMSERCEYSEDRNRLKELADLLRKVTDKS